MDWSTEVRGRLLASKRINTTTKVAVEVHDLLCVIDEVSRLEKLVLDIRDTTEFYGQDGGEKIDIEAKRIRAEEGK